MHPAVLVAFLVVPPPVDYAHDVKPLLRERCYACHGALAQKGGLRLDAGSMIRKGGTSGADLDLLLERVSDPDEATRMPPEGLPLTPAQVATLKAWVGQGAKVPADDAPEADPRDHWAFRKPAKAAVPSGAHPVDHFVEAEWRKRGLEPAPEADPRTLVRRLYLDLIGLPPTPEQVAAFVRDPSPAAYAKLVDALLASPRYGERWGRHFLDIWRYSDWWGFGIELRASSKHMWHWRDWVIESVNADIGYDEMARRMLAADELHPTDPRQLRATGYLARQYFKFNRNTWLDETVEHTAKAFVGLTFNCARCHDHKYDPISQKDYYRFRAIFEPYQIRTDLIPGQPDVEKDGIPRAFDCDLDRPTFVYARGDEKQPQKTPMKPGLPAVLAPNGFAASPIDVPLEAHSPHMRKQVLETLAEAAEKQDGAVGVAAVRAKAALDLAMSRAYPGGFTLRSLLAASQDAERRAAVELCDAVMEAAVAAEKAVAVSRADRAVVKAEAALAEAARALAGTAGVRRIGPAIVRSRAERAVTDAKKKADLVRTKGAVRNAASSLRGEADIIYTPLRGSIKTPETNVESEESRYKPFPTTSTGRRSALANWVASRDNPLTARVLVNHVWLRHVGRPLVGTVFDFGRKGSPPTHPELLDWLAVDVMEHGWSIKHLHRRIVTSRAYRLSSDVSPSENDPENRYLSRMNAVRMDAPTVRDSLLSLAGELDTTLGGPPVPPKEHEVSRRRSVYFFQSHNEHDKFLATFDDANVLDCYRRTVSVVPQQALALANSSFAMSKGEAIAAKIVADTDAAFVDAAFDRILCSTPTAAERAACLDALERMRAAAPGLAAEKRTRARVNLVRALLNHNDFVTVR